MTLTEFLLARIAEDESEYGLTMADVQDIGPGQPGYRWGVVAANSKYSPRMLLECESKRRIVEHCDYDHLTLSPGDPYVLQLLALPYADHPDFREEWRL